MLLKWRQIVLKKETTITKVEQQKLGVDMLDTYKVAFRRCLREKEELTPILTVPMAEPVMQVVSHFGHRLHHEPEICGKHASLSPGAALKPIGNRDI
jgi:hypothetical protein